MGWFDKLKTLFDIKISLNISPTIKLVKVDNSNNASAGKEYVYNEKENVLVLNAKNLTEDKNQELKSITKEYIQDGNMLLKDDASRKFQEVESYNKKGRENDKQILEFFKDIIPPKDLDTLEVSLFLRDEFRNHYDIKEMKQDIRRKFGDRGNNISNLCTAGYFENFLTELHKVSTERFKELYELIVSNSVLAVFVNAQMSDFQVADEIKKKINASLQYGFKDVYIHGIGTQNINKIRRCIEKNKEFFDFYEKIIFERENVIIVKLLIKPKAV